jgi:hypothetical protein
MAAKAKCKIDPIGFDKAKAIRELLAAAEKFWRELVLTWAENVQDAIVVDTGMSASSIAPLADYVGGPGTGRIITGRRTRRGVTLIDGKYEPNMIKSPETGAELGQDAFDFAVGTVANPKYTFGYSIAIYQWARHEAKWRATVEPGAYFDRESAEFYAALGQILSRGIFQ